MLYAHDIRNNSVSLKLMIQKIVSEYETNDNAEFRRQVIDIIQNAKRLHCQEISIYNLSTTFFQEIIFLSNNATEKIFEHADDTSKERFMELLKILCKIK